MNDSNIPAGIRPFPWITRLVVIAALMLLMFYGGLVIYGDWNDAWNGYTARPACTIAVVPIIGEVVTTSMPAREGKGGDYITDLDQTLALIRHAQEDSSIEGILVRIDSGGGSPVAGQAIMRALSASTLPTLALIRDQGASAAYQIATGTDHIIASEYSDVGSIGITMSYLDYAKQNEDQGLHYNNLSSGKFKDSGSPDKGVTPEERSLFERDIKVMYEQFVKEVSENRGIALAEVTKFADGSTMAGQMAFENRLIDQIGDQETARTWFAEKLETKPQNVVFCE